MLMLSHRLSENNPIFLWLWISLRKYSHCCLGLHTNNTITIEKYDIVCIISLPVKTAPCWRHGQNMILKAELGAQVFVMKPSCDVTSIFSTADILVDLGDLASSKRFCDFYSLSAGARLARLSLGKQFQTAQQPMDLNNQLTNLWEKKEYWE